MLLKKFFELSKKPLARPLVFSRKQMETKNHPMIKMWTGEKRILGYIEARLAGKIKILVFTSPEAEAITTGLVGWENGALRYIPARWHTGAKRSIDALVAGHQAVQMPAVKEVLAGLNNPNEELIIVDLLREGQKTCLSEGFYFNYGITPTNVLLSISHVPDTSTPLGRRAKVNKPNLEGVNPKKVKILVLSDAVASGTNQFFAINFFQKIFPNLEKVVVVAAHLTQYGAEALGKFLINTKMTGVIIGFSALLKSNPPQMYFSPTPVNDPDKFADPAQAGVMKMIYGVAAEKLCVAGNWSAMFLSPQVGMEWLEKELKEQGLTIDEIKSKIPSIEKIKKELGGLEKIIPASTYLEAANDNLLDKLKNI